MSNLLDLCQKANKSILKQQIIMNELSFAHQHPK